MKKKVLKISVIVITLVCFIGIILSFIPVYSASVTPANWKDISTVSNDYSYSTVFFDSTTRFKVYKYNGVANNNPPELTLTQFREQYFVENDADDEDDTPTRKSGRVYIDTGQDFIMLITNCAVNSSGQTLDVLVKVDEVTAFKNQPKGNDPHVTFGIASFNIPKNQKKMCKEAECYTHYGLSDDPSEDTFGTPIAFHFGTNRAKATFTMTYYIAGTYGTAYQSLGGIGKVNGLYWDIDVAGTDNKCGSDGKSECNHDSELFKGYEGIKPNVASTIYYNSDNTKADPDYTHHLQVTNNGIAFKERGENAKTTNQMYYETSAFIQSEVSDSTYSFTYSGRTCGIKYTFLSPYPFDITKPTKRVASIDNGAISFTRPGEKFKYIISQYVPNNYFAQVLSYNQVYDKLYGKTRYSTFKISDTLDNHLIPPDPQHISDIKVFNELSANVTDYFTISVEGQTVTATVKSGALDAKAFYSHTYNIEVPVTVSPSLADNGVNQVCNLAVNVKTDYAICQSDSDCSPVTLNIDNNVCLPVRYSLTNNYYEDTPARTPVATPEVSADLAYGSPYGTNYDRIVANNYAHVDNKQWVYSRNDGDAPSGTITKNTVVNYYFKKKEYKLIVNYYEDEAPYNKLYDSTEEILYYGNSYNTSEYYKNKTNINLKKWYVSRITGDAEIGNIDGSREEITINYYFKKIPYKLTVNYYGTDQFGSTTAIAEPKVTDPIYYDDKYYTDYNNINLKKWQLTNTVISEGTGNIVTKEDDKNKVNVVEGQITGNTVVDYYFELVPYPVTVNYYDADTHEEIAAKDETIYYYDMLYYTDYDKINMDVWEYVSTDGDPINGRITGDQKSYTINYYFNRLKYELIVNYYDEETKEKIDRSDRAAYNFGDEYDTNYDKIDENYWEYVRTEGETPGVISEDTEVDYYFNNKEYTLEVEYYDEETGEKIEDPEISSHKFGEEYTTNDDKIDKKKWELVEEPENKEGTIEDDTEVKYFYRKRKYKIIVNYYEEGTEDKIIESREYEAYYGDKYITDYNGVDEDVWTLVGMPENYQGEVDGDVIVNYYFKQVVIENPPTGENKNNKPIFKIIATISIMLVLIVFTYRLLLKRKIYKI